MPCSGALFSSAGFSFLPTSKRWCALMPFISTSLHISVAPHTLYQSSFSKVTIAFGAGLIYVVIKVLSSEQQEHTGDDAATHSTPHLVQASLRHGRSRAVSDCLNTPHSSTQTRQYMTLFWLDNGEYGSHEKIGRRVIFKRFAVNMLRSA